ncbi:MAG: VCBS repeat-containing protein [Pseudomonadota bacterium]
MRLLAFIFAGFAASAEADIRFEDRSSALPKHIYAGGWEHFVGGGVAIFDCDADALPDLFVAGGANPAKLLRNAGNFTFHAGDLPELTGVTGAYPIDIDADGIKDLFVLRVGPNVVLRGGPDCSFTESSHTWGIPANDAWSTAFTAWWEPEHDRPVMAVGNYVDLENPDGPFEACDDNVILRPSNTGYSAHRLSPGYCPLSILAARDARNQPSLRLSNDRHYYVKDGFEQMWDIAQRRFLTADDGWHRVSLWGMGIASRDLNGDHQDEVMLTSMGDQLLQIAVADGSYRAAPFSLGTYAQRPHMGDDGRPSTGWHAEFGDVDNDGDADLFIAKGNVDQMPGMATRDPNNLLLQQADGRFVEHAAQSGVAAQERSRGAGLVDVDLDGRLDLIVVNRRAPLRLYRNVSTNTGHWLRIVLRQSGGNRDAIGARISVQTSRRAQSVQHVVGGGHAGGQLIAKHFGLGQELAAAVTVNWPDGTVSHARLEANQTHVITKP